MHNICQQTCRIRTIQFCSPFGRSLRFTIEEVDFGCSSDGGGVVLILCMVASPMRRETNQINKNVGGLLADIDETNNVIDSNRQRTLASSDGFEKSVPL